MGHTGNGPQPKQFLRPCLLLLLRERSGYGYDLVTRLRPLGVDDDSAAVYRALRSLEHDGAVVSQWKEPVTGPARRVYRLTPDGVTLLERWVRDLDATRHSLERFLDRHDHFASPGRRGRGDHRWRAG